MDDLCSLLNRPEATVLSGQHYWKISFTMLFTSALLFLGCQAQQPQTISKDCEQWIAKIDDEKICQDDVDMEYDAVVETYAKMQGLAKDKFLEIINNEEEARNQPLLMQLRKNNFINRYVNEYLFYKEALRNKINEKDLVKAMIQYQRKSIISQFYLETMLDDELIVSDEEVETFYKKNRDKIPAHMRQMPISEVLNHLRRYLMEQKKQMLVQQKVQEMRDRFKIEMNKALAPDNDNNLLQDLPE